MSKQSKIKAQFDYWWETARIGISVADEIKLRNAFLSVILKIPEADRERFFMAGPVVLCFAAIGCVEASPSRLGPMNESVNLMLSSSDTTS